jgi:hypothetical protein
LGPKNPPAYGLTSNFWANAPVESSVMAAVAKAMRKMFLDLIYVLLKSCCQAEPDFPSLPLASVVMHRNSKDIQKIERLSGFRESAAS